MNRHRNPNLFIGLALMMFVLFTTMCAQADEEVMTNPIAPHAHLDQTIFNNDFFPLLTWDQLHGWDQGAGQRKNGLASMKECGFNIGGFVYAEDLKECEKLGLKAIVVPKVDGLSAWTRAWKTLSDEEIDTRIRELVEATGDSPALVGFYLIDEPGATSFPALGKAVAAVKKYAPGKLAYINLFPGYATIGAPDTSQLETESFTEYLERYVEEVDPQFISYDNYQVQYSQDMQNAARASLYYSDLLEVRRVAQEHNLPYWLIVSSNQIRPFTTIPSPANLRYQAYTGLAAGFNGITWYTYYSRGYGYAPIAEDGERNITWTYLRGVNHEIQTIGSLMNHLKSTGLYFTAPAPVEGLPTLPGKIVDAVECEQPVMVGEFENEKGEPFVMLVNLSMQNSAKMSPKRNGEPITGKYFSPQDGRPLPIDYEHGLWAVAGQGILIQPDS